ncbi:hypothetical protein QJQ45_017518 [Haematococcus lacustris]|nr:hypothetical protein QJQ45_017518 [Haematococcus lacustris]
MVFNGNLHTATPSIGYKHEILPVVREFKYLGMHFHPSATPAFAATHIRAFVLPMGLFGSQVWGTAFLEHGVQLSNPVQTRMLSFLRFAARVPGAADITVAEVLTALTSCPSTSSPGPDGLPYNLWRVDGDCWAPLIAKLFTAIGTTGTLPTGFNRGTITPIPKPSAPNLSNPTSYRPITLLPSLYRLLAKILAARFGKAMAPAIGRVQSAFLPGRRIEDNINTTSLLPHALQSQGLSAANIYFDIAKAFDTVDRHFLYTLMHTLGASDGMVNWARILLHNTQAVTHVNGTDSPLFTWSAGVRQGCPLSPLLYLLAQGFASWLISHPQLGVRIGGSRLVCTFFADDTQIHQGDLTDPALSTLSLALTTFGDASGQRVNTDKSSAVLIGVPLPSPPTHLAGIPVHHSATSLGIQQANPTLSSPTPRHTRATRASLRPPNTLSPHPDPATSSAWEERLRQATKHLHRLNGLPLSTMGKGIASSTYALSTFLYHAEFSGLPPTLPTFTHTLYHLMVKNLPYPLAIGRPADGGLASYL